MPQSRLTLELKFKFKFKSQFKCTMDYSGATAVVQMIEDGLGLDDIVDRYGRAVDPRAEQFMRYHKQAKRILINHCVENNQLCEWLKAKDPLPRAVE